MELDLGALCLRLVLAGWVVSVSFAQNPEASLLGAVTDATGSRVAGARLLVESLSSPLRREAFANSLGEYRIDSLAPGRYRVDVMAPGFQTAETEVALPTGVPVTLPFVLHVSAGRTAMEVRAPVDSTGSAIQTVVSSRDIDSIPLAHRSFANIAYLAPMTSPVEPSDPTKARITAVSFAGSSGLNVDLSLDGGDNNDDYTGGSLQNVSPDAIQEFTIRTAQFDADTSHTNGGSVIITTRHGSDDWTGSAAGYFRERWLNARNTLDNPQPNPKQPFSRRNAVQSLGGPVVRQRLWFFSTFEYVMEDASVAYSTQSQREFRALAQLAAAGMIPGVNALQVPSSSPVAFADSLFTTRIDSYQSARSQWFLRGVTDHYDTHNDLVQQGTFPSTGAYARSGYYSVLLHNQVAFAPHWLGALTVQANSLHHTERRNSNYGFALAFPFSSNFRATSAFETFGDNQFVTPFAAFPIQRDQQKYQARYDIVHSGGSHDLRFGVNIIHEPVLSGRLSDNPETLITFPHDPSYYVTHPLQFVADYQGDGVFSAGSSGVFSQSIRRLGLYVQDSWRVTPSLTFNLGLRYDTTFGLFRASGRGQEDNSAFITLKTLGIPLVPGVPHDYRGALAPRAGVAWSRNGVGKTVVRMGFGLYYNDLSQNGWVDAFRAVNHPPAGLLQPNDQGALIDPGYKTPYAVEASFAAEHAVSKNLRINVQFEHQQGVHQYRRYEYVSGFALPPDAPSISLFRSDNRSRYDGVSFGIQHRFSRRFDFSAHYTLANAATWGAVAGELFDYVNLVTNPLRAFAPGDHGPSGEDVRHRFVFAGTVLLRGRVELAALGQFESARPFTLTTPLDLNHDGDNTNDRAAVNGRQTTLDQFRGTPYMQIDVRLSRPIRLSERIEMRPFVELFNIFNRQNSGNNYVSSVAALPIPPDELGNVQQFCLNIGCSSMRPVTLNDLRVPAGALGDLFGPGTTVGVPFTAQLGVRLTL
jgi:hypothetical protein